MSDLKVNGTSPAPKDGPLSGSLNDQNMTIEPKRTKKS